jgi:uncharacterized protein YxjI
VAIPSVSRPALHVRVRGPVQPKVPPVLERNHPQKATPQLPARGIVGRGGGCAVRHHDDDGRLALFGSKRREQRRFDDVATCYKMRQRMISIGDDYEIENDQGERVFKLDGKALRIRKTILFRDMDGHELCKIQKRMLHLRDSMEIEGPDGNRMAMVHKAMITPLRERWIAKLEDGPDLHAQGNIVDHEYTIERDGTKVAEVSKRWFRIRDSYGVEVAPGENDILILATAAVIDTMAHPAR